MGDPSILRADRQLLRHELLEFTPDQFAVVGQAFNKAIRAHGYTCYALAIMPDHAHLIVRKHKDRAEDMIENLQNLTA